MSVRSKLQIPIVSTHSTDADGCQVEFDSSSSDGDSLLWIRYSYKTASLYPISPCTKTTLSLEIYGKFSQSALLDQQVRTIQFSNVGSIIYLTIPHFWQSAGN